MCPWNPYGVFYTMAEAELQKAAAQVNRENAEKAQLAPELLLADMLRDDLNVEIDPRALRIFIRARWPKLAPIAHAIHGSA